MAESPTPTTAQLRAALNAVEEFIVAFKSLMELYGENSKVWGAGLLPDVIPLENADHDEIRRRTDLVARAAGRAAAVSGLTGTFVRAHGPNGTVTVDPIAAWQSITQPKPSLGRDDVLGAAEQAAGRLEALLAGGETASNPALQLSSLHPTIGGAASALWRDRHCRNAVMTAAEALTLQVRGRVGRKDIQADSLWKESLSLEPPQPGKPRLRYPGDDNDLTIRSIRTGILQLAQGLNALTRNVTTHNLDEMDPQEALEQLGALSLLARRLDECDVLAVDEQGKVIARRRNDRQDE